jgi:hypothetical protein
LEDLGASQQHRHSPLWNLEQPGWTALIELKEAELRVTWLQGGEPCQRTFSYGLSRADVQAAILAGP